MADEITLRAEEEEEEDEDEEDEEEDEEEEDSKKHKKDRGFDGDLGRGLIKSRTVMLTDGIDAKLATRVTAQLLLLDQQDAEKPIRMFINSPGGQVDSGFAIYDMIRFVRAPVKAIVAGMAASAAALILVAPKKENRFALPNARILIHQPMVGGFGGVATDIKIAAEQMIKIKERINRIIADATGQPLKKVVEDADRDFWLSAEEAIEYGLISKVVAHYDEIE